MATTSGYDYGIRQGLVNKGVNSADIAYNPGTGYVTVKGQNAIKAPKVYNGTSFTTQQDFNTQYDAFNKAQQQPAQSGFQPTGMAGTASGTGYGAAPARTGYQPTGMAGTPQQPTPAYAPQGAGYAPPSMPSAPSIDQRIAELYSALQNQPTFDPYSSSAYAAAQAQADRAAQQNIRQAQESFGSSGFGRSTALGERAQRIGQEGTEYLMTQVLPQIQAQEEARRQQQFQNLFTLLSPQQEQQQFAEQQRQFAEQTAQGRAGLTGSFISPEAQQTINQLMGLKQQAEAPTITREGRAGLSSQADILRNQLLGMGVDPSLFGAGVTSAQATQNIGRAGTPTLAGQAQKLAAQGQQFEQDITTRQLDRADFESDRQFEFAKGQQEWENNFNSAQFNWNKAQQAWENAFKEKDFQQSMKEAAAARGLQWASLNQRDKEFIADSAFREKQFAYEQEQDKLKQTEQGDYTTDPSFAEDISWINTNPQNAVAEIRAQSKALIEQYGIEGYESLLKAAQDAASE